MVDNGKNIELVHQPTKEEIKSAVYGLNGESAGGPDGFNGTFFHSCWDIIGDDIVDSDSYTLLVSLLPSLISDEQAGFVKGRSIVENVLLTQEIVTDIRLRTKAGPTVVIKLDMAKAYDRLSWLFLSKVLRKMGFGERFIGLPHGFFRSTRGVKQVYMHHSTSAQVIDKVQRITGIPKQEFLFTYLGYPIFYLRRNMDYYKDLITKVMDKLQSWKGKLLSIGGREVLISHVLQSMPIHLLSAVNPPAYVIN
ncbi:PREDICTED: uncharacterized protein LOC109220430 [Nicotiana attenuata]|uniref:uncharacterized protein LOC109220430 n=1 Tax=Nicotiana attenuata TaxID=49451 RepID=UPI00090501A8|nr:PREDICTED: uncharacterized protein LOC109220430 [Nicotiana attenuata]